MFIFYFRAAQIDIIDIIISFSFLFLSHSFAVRCIIDRMADKNRS